MNYLLTRTDLVTGQVITVASGGFDEATHAFTCEVIAANSGDIRHNECAAMLTDGSICLQLTHPNGTVLRRVFFDESSEPTKRTATAKDGKTLLEAFHPEATNSSPLKPACPPYGPIKMKNTQTLPIGCIFDGAHGDDFNGLRIQELAAKYGWNGQQEDENSLEFQDAIDEATAYLEQFAPVGYYAAWEDGNYGVWKDESEYNLQTPCPSCGREDDGEWIAPCPADDCPSHWEEKGIAHPEHRTDF